MAGGNPFDERLAQAKPNILGQRGNADRPSYVVRGECWISTGKSNGSKHRMMNSKPAHRAAYEIAIGPIPQGHVCHHACSTPDCVRPSHLIAMLPGEHARLHAYLRNQSRQTELERSVLSCEGTDTGRK